MGATMLRRFLTTVLVILLSVSTLAFSDAPLALALPHLIAAGPANPEQTQLADGEYLVQQATYDDADGEYRLVLLNTPPGQPSVFRTTNLPMARLTDEAIAAGQKSYLKVEANQPTLYLTEDFKIEYIHTVTENRQNPQTGQPETVVVRRESNFWTPFAGALAGQALGSLLFSPYHYVPPLYVPGQVMTGYGGYGRSYDQAVSNYQSRYKAPPAAVKNRKTFRTTGQLKNTPAKTNSAKPGFGGFSRQKTAPTTRSTGSGYGTSLLKRSASSPSSTSKRPTSSFGSARPRSSFGSGVRPRSSFGGSMRRR